MTYFKTIMTPSGKTRHSIPQVSKLNLMNTVLLESYGRFLHTADVLGVCKSQFDVHSISRII